MTERTRTAVPALGTDPVYERITHGRHCICSACARQDWSEPFLACCGMHGSSCARLYQPLGAPGQTVLVQRRAITFSHSRAEADRG